MARLADLGCCNPASTLDVRDAGEGMSTRAVDDGIGEDFGEAGWGLPCPASSLAESPCFETRGAFGRPAQMTATCATIQRRHPSP